MVQILSGYLVRIIFHNKILVFTSLFSFAMDFDFKMETSTVCHETKFEWKIRNFSELPDQVQSQSFFPLKGSPISWRVQLSIQNLSLSLWKTDKENAVPHVKVTGKVSIKNSKGKLWGERDFKVFMKNENFVHCFNILECRGRHPSIIPFRDFIDDIFIAEWSMTVYDIVTSIVTPVPILTRDANEEVDIDSILKVIYKKNAFTDITFHFGEETLRAHKAVLSARSPVLEKMFEHDTLEKQTNSVAIEDIEFQVFNCFIGFMYTNEIKEEIKADVEALLALYEVADKYEVLDLQKRCADILLSDFLNVNTACKILQMADKHHDYSFKEAAMKFLRHRFSEVTKTPEWSHFTQENVKLTSEIVAFVMELLNNKAPN